LVLRIINKKSTVMLFCLKIYLLSTHLNQLNKSIKNTKTQKHILLDRMAHVAGPGVTAREQIVGKTGL
jgi:hypothetical protein